MVIYSINPSSKYSLRAITPGLCHARKARTGLKLIQTTKSRPHTQSKLLCTLEDISLEKNSIAFRDPIPQCKNPRHKSPETDSFSDDNPTGPGNAGWVYRDYRIFCHKSSGLRVDLFCLYRVNMKQKSLRTCYITSLLIFQAIQQQK